MSKKDLPSPVPGGAIRSRAPPGGGETPAEAGEGRARLIFAMDATASREPTWDRACQVQGQMFLETAALGGLEVQLVYYRGFASAGRAGGSTTRATWCGS